MLGDSPKNRMVSTKADTQIIKPNKQYEAIFRILEISFIMLSPKLQGQEVDLTDGKRQVFQILSSGRREHYIKIN